MRKIPKNWRRVKRGDVIRRGDKYHSWINNKWKETESAGDTALGLTYIRRRREGSNMKPKLCPFCRVKPTKNEDGSYWIHHRKRCYFWILKIEWFLISKKDLRFWNTRKEPKHD
jgi:hypothetical protein